MLERWLSDLKCLLLLQRTQAWIPALTHGVVHNRDASPASAGTVSTHVHIPFPVNVIKKSICAFSKSSVNISVSKYSHQTVS